MERWFRNVDIIYEPTIPEDTIISLAKSTIYMNVDLDSYESEDTVPERDLIHVTLSKISASNPEQINQIAPGYIHIHVH